VKSTKKVIHDYPEWTELFHRPQLDRYNRKLAYALDSWKAQQARNRMFLAPNGIDYRTVEFVNSDNRCRMSYNGHRIYGYIVNGKFIPDKKVA